MSTTRDASPDGRIWARQILDEQRVTDRCHRQWVATGKFPPPDGNLNGRNFWLHSTYEAWKLDVLSGRYAQRRRPGTSAPTEPRVA